MTRQGRTVGGPFRLVGVPEPARQRGGTAAPEPLEVARIVLPGRRHSVAVGRHWIVDTAATNGVTGMANQIVELLSSELLANAVLHGPEGGSVFVQVALGDGHVRITVADTGTGAPVVLQRDPGASSGRGMAIVDALAARWGSHADDTGTTVWFEVALDT